MGKLPRTSLPSRAPACISSPRSSMLRECRHQALEPRVRPNGRDQVRPPHEPAGEGFAHRLLQLLLAHAPGCRVDEGAKGRRPAEPGSLLDILGGQYGFVKDAPARRGLPEA